MEIADIAKKYNYDRMEQSDLTYWAKWSFARIPYRPPEELAVKRRRDKLGSKNKGIAEIG